MRLSRTPPQHIHLEEPSASRRRKFCSNRLGLEDAQGCSPGWSIEGKLRAERLGRLRRSKGRRRIPRFFARWGTDPRISDRGRRYGRFRTAIDDDSGPLPRKRPLPMAKTDSPSRILRQVRVCP